MASTKTDSIFLKALQLNASDVHIAVGVPIFFRIDDVMAPVSKGPLSAADVNKIVKSVLGEKAYKRFLEEREIDVSYLVGGGLRMRVNCHFERGNPGLVARIIPQDIPTLEEIGLEDRKDQLCGFREGLLLFTGPAGCGKSTSMASIISSIRESKPVHVVTLEDPIEFIFPKKGEGVVRQRQYGEDFHSFAEALKRVLRQDPDIVMVGEMRDLETISAALTLAETGHLVFATLHTANAMQSVDRIVDVFPPHQQDQVRSQLSLSLRAIIAQRLLPRKDGGLVAAREILINTPAVAHIIRENRVQEIVSLLQMGMKDGMTTFEADAKRLKKEGLIDSNTLESTVSWISYQLKNKKK